MIVNCALQVCDMNERVETIDSYNKIQMEWHFNNNGRVSLQIPISYCTSLQHASVWALGNNWIYMLYSYLQAERNLLVVRWFMMYDLWSRKLVQPTR